jgi:hypothetical protein
MRSVMLAFAATTLAVVLADRSADWASLHGWIERYSLPT